MGDALEALIMSCQKERHWFNLHFYPGKSRPTGRSEQMGRKLSNNRVLHNQEIWDRQFLGGCVRVAQ
jgi:hypothetical protein